MRKRMRRMTVKTKEMTKRRRKKNLGERKRRKQRYVRKRSVKT